MDSLPLTSPITARIESLPLKWRVRVFTSLLTQWTARSASAFRATRFLLACSLLLEPIWSLPCSAAPISLVADHVPLRGGVATVSSTPRNQPIPEKEQLARLFGLDTEPVAWGPLLEKWHHLKAEIVHDLGVVEQCRANGPCPVPAQKLIDLASEGASRSGRARVGLINRAVNFAITPVSDEAQWGVPDRWSGPLETLRSRHGDCEDYAILKYVALLEAGISKEDLKIVILKNRLPNEDHAAVAARADGQWLILDNRTLTLVRDVDVARAIPIFVLDDDGVRRFVGSSRDRRRLADSVPATLSSGWAGGTLPSLQTALEVKGREPIAHQRRTPKDGAPPVPIAGTKR